MLLESVNCIITKIKQGIHINKHAFEHIMFSRIINSSVRTNPNSLGTDTTVGRIRTNLNTEAYCR